MATAEYGSHSLTADEMDEMRKKNIVYQYLCHLEEAKKWIEACIEEELPDAEHIEENLRHGVYLAKLANFFSPDDMPKKNIFDISLDRYNSNGLHFRHTDNINYFINAMKKVGLPSIFYPETTDIYDKKNIPRAVFCIHALSLYLFRLGIAPQIQNLYGKIKFSDEVMEAMMNELSKFGCQLPQFGKIGGILANELPVDEAALHAAIIAVNESIKKQDPKELLSTLMNPSSHLVSVFPESIDNYISILYDAKQEKKEIAINKSRDENYIPDAYDELLTQAEIQGYINQSNLISVVETIEEMIFANNFEGLMKYLTSPFLSLKTLKKENGKEYLSALKVELELRKDQSFNQSLVNCTLSKSSIQKVIQKVNSECGEKSLNERKLSCLNNCLRKGISKDTLNALYDMQSVFSPVALFDYAAPLYHEEMAAIQSESQTYLSLEEVIGGVKFLTAIARISYALESGDSLGTWKFLSDPQVHIQNLDKPFIRDYVQCLIKALLCKAEMDDPCTLLTHLDIQETIDQVNEKKREDSDKVGAVTNLNSAVNQLEVDKTISSLQHPALGLRKFSVSDGFHYFQLLKNLKKVKCEALKLTDTELWLEDINEVNEVVQEHLRVLSKVVTFVQKINHALIMGNKDIIPNILRSSDVPDFHIRRDLISEVSQNIFETFLMRHKKGFDCYPVVEYILQDGSEVYLNVETGTHQWKKPVDYLRMSQYISIIDVSNIVSETVDNIELNKKVENSFIRLQAVCRGYLVRNLYDVYREAAIKIQSWWRMIQVHRSYTMYKKALLMWEPEIIKIQRAFRSYRRRKRINSITSHFSKKQEHQVKIIQRAWRKYKARLDLHALTHCKDPPLPVIRKFVHLLEVSSLDFEEELRLQKLKSELVKTIRRAQSLESQVDEMDVKIGLLVHNRISLQDVINSDKENVNPSIADAGTKKHKKYGKELERYSTLRSQRGLKALTKESRVRLIGYQHLFYLLQTEPHYMASLIFALPPGKTTKFIENVIFTLYNYGANDRDNYLLLKLFKTALEEEIRCKVLRLSDIVSGNPLVVKMVVSFNRKGAGQMSLREMLGPLVNMVLANSNMQINTNPVDIYRTWVNQLEMNTGQPSGLPYVVNQEQALQYPEVQKRLVKAINLLRETTLAFCNHITTSRHLIPYAMLYMAKVMKSALHKRFPHIPEKEILKVVGNLIYYRFINSAIVAPDAFDIITVTPDKMLTNDQRRNLASISKILQFAASKKGFGEEASHLTGLNPFIIECHEKFKQFFKDCCMVDDPDTVYNVNQYSEATIIIKPTIYITLQEIVETHQLLLDHEDILASDPNDPLHDLLVDLGERPSIFTLIGETPNFDNPNTIGPIGRTEVCLALSKKVDLQDESAEHQKEGKDSTQKLFIKTKQLIIDILQCINGNLLYELTTGPTLSEQEAKYRNIVTTRSQQEHKAKLNETGLNRSNSFLGETRVSLHEVKTKLSHNLRRLENQGMSSRSDNYQTLLNAIAVDIVNQRKYRISRRNELQKLVHTSRQLETKENFYKEQLQSYKSYLETCLMNIAGRNKNVHQCSSGKSKDKKRTIKYTASKLHEKGVVLEIEDLPPQQLKNVLFEITPLSSTGVFQVHVKFMGVAMEVVQLDIQDLLQLQYEGVSVKRMMGKAKINVNLLLHFLNSKFYCKKK